MTEQDDRALVLAILAGDRDAVRVLIDRYQGIVFSLCLRMMNHRHDAEDVVQETFLRAIRSLSGFDRDRAIRPWLLRIAANRCRTALARQPRQVAAVEVVIETADPSARLSDPDDLAGELQRAIDKLRPEYRQVFLLFHEHNLPYEEIALGIDRPVGTVKTWLHRARAELADHLTRRGVHCSER